MNGGEAELVIAVHIRLVLRVLQQQPDVLDVHVLCGHVYGGAVQLRIHVVGTSPAGEQSLSLISSWSIVKSTSQK